MPKVTPAYHALSERLPIYPPRFSPPSVLLLSLSLPLSMDRPYSSFFFPLLSLFSFTSRRRLTVVPCFLYRLAPVLRAIQPTLYEKTLKSFFATGRASWLLLQPETAATVSSDAIRKLGENASIYACNVYIYIYTREKIARYSFSAILSNSFVSSFFFGFSVVSTPIFCSSVTKKEGGERITTRTSPVRTRKWISRRARRSRNDRDAISADQVSGDKLFLG